MYSNIKHGSQLAKYIFITYLFMLVGVKINNK